MMFKIFDAFVEQATAHHGIPVIVLLPLNHEVAYQYRRHASDPRRKKIMAYCKAKQYRCFDGVNALASAVRTSDDINTFVRGHVTAKGNRIIAQKLYRYLQRQFPDLIKQAQEAALPVVATE